MQILLWPCIRNTCNLSWCDEKTIQQHWTKLKNSCHQSEWIARLQFKQTYEQSQYAGLTICTVDSALPFEMTPSDAFCTTYVIFWFMGLLHSLKKQLLWQFANKLRRYCTDISGIYFEGSIFKSIFEHLHFTNLNERWRENTRKITVRKQEPFYFRK